MHHLSPSFAFSRCVQEPTEYLFGLGRREKPDRITIRWIGGVDVIENVAVDRLVTIIEGMSPQGPAERVRK
jgi:hypothetical protein